MVPSKLGQAQPLGQEPSPSLPFLQHLGQEGMETALWTPLGPGTLLEAADGQTTALAQDGAIGSSEHQQ